MQKLLRKRLMKVLFIAAMLTGMSSWGQTIIISEGFESGLPSGYNSSTSYSLSSGTWTGQANGVTKGTTGVVGGSASCQLKSASGAQVTTPNITAGVSTVTFYGSSSTSGGSVQVNYSTDGGSNWIAASGSPFTLTTGSGVLKTATINSSSPNILVQFLRAASTVYIDNVEIKSYTAAVPTVNTTAGSYGPFCTNTSNNIVVNYTTGGTGTFTGTYSVQRSNESGTFPSDATSNLLATVTTSGNSITATLPSGLTAGNYRVRVVNSTPATYSSNDNGSNIVINSTVAATVTSSAATSVGNTTATLNGTVTALGVCPNTTERGFVYSQTAVNSNPVVNGTGVTKTSVAGLTTTAYNLSVSALSAATGYTFKAYAFDGTTYTYSTAATFSTTGTPPSLTAAASASVDAPFTVTFTDDAAWRAASPVVKVGATTLTAGYSITAGQLIFTPSASSPANLLQSSGTKTITVSATGYSDATVSQTIDAGTATNLSVSTQPTAPSVNGGPIGSSIVLIRDQYNNTTTSTSQVTAAVGAGAWTIGGTTQVNAVAGSATFSALTATSAAAVTGATITYSISTPSSISVASGSFNIPVPTPANDLCGNATTLNVNDPATAGTLTGATVTTSGFSGSGSNIDVWYTFTATCSGSHTITISNYSGSVTAYLFSGSSCPTANSNNIANSTTTITQTLTSGTVYKIRVAALNTTAQTTNFNIRVQSVPAAPTVTTTSTPNTFGATTATISGTATVTGCSSTITDYGIQYSTSSTFASGNQTVGGGTITAGAFSSSLTGLTSNTMYYYRAYATNATGTTYGSTTYSFTTTTVPVTIPYTQNFEDTTNEWLFGTTGTNKWMIGTATNNGGSHAMYISENGSTNTYKVTSTQTGTYAEVKVDLTSVTAATLTFDWKSMGEIFQGTPLDYGEVYINTGSSDILISNAKEFYNVSAFQSREINLTPYVGGIRTLRFKWANDNVAGNQPPFAIDNVSIVSGAKPALTTTAISNIAYNAATSGGNITSDNGSPVTVRGIVYGTSSAPTLANSSIASGSGTGAFSADITGLSDNTTYYVRAYATNSMGTSYGNEVSFTTSAINAPLATSATYSDTAGTGFIANWNASPVATEYFLDVATTSDFGGTAISENFSGYNDVTRIDLTGMDPYMQQPGWTGVQVYQDSGFAKLGTGSAIGSITTPTINLSNNGGVAKLTVDIAKYGNDNAVVQVFHSPNGTEAGFVQVGSDISTVTNFTTYTFNITGGTSASKIRIASKAITSNYRFYVDNISVTYKTTLTGYDNLSVGNTTSRTLTGLTAGNTYYYKVRAKGPNSTSANSNIISATAKQTNVWNGAAWTAGVPPTNLEKAVINGDYNTSDDGELTAGYLSVNNGTFTIADGDNVTITNEVVVDNDLDETGEIVGPKIVIENNANLIQVNDVANSGNIEVQKNSAPIYRLDYTMWSSPVAGETLIGFSPETLSNRFYHYNPLSDAYTTIDGGNIAFEEGVGYLIRVANTHPDYVEGEEGTPWSGTFTGVPNNGDVDVTVIPADSGSGVKGFNAVGNPYPSPINIHDFYDANIGSIDPLSALYFWRKKNDGNTSSYAKVTKLAYTANQGNDWGDSSNGVFTGDASDWVINPGQGFIVKATGSTIHFNNAMRVPVNNNQQFRTAQDEETNISRLWLNLTGSQGAFSQAAIGYTPQTTLGVDYGWDGRAFTDGDVALFSYIEEEKIGIQARPAFTAEDVVPLGYKAFAAGSYTIALDHMDGVFAQDQDIYLRDNLLGITQDLKQEAYSFATEAGTFAGRFDVIYAQELGTDIPTLNENSIIVYQQGNSITINSGATDMTGVAVYDLRGRMLYSNENINATETVISGLQAQQQMLIIQVTTSKGKVSRKIVF